MVAGLDWRRSVKSIWPCVMEKSSKIRRGGAPGFSGGFGGGSRRRQAGKVERAVRIDDGVDQRPFEADLPEGPGPVEKAFQLKVDKESFEPGYRLPIRLVHAQVIHFKVYTYGLMRTSPIAAFF